MNKKEVVNFQWGAGDILYNVNHTRVREYKNIFGFFYDTLQILFSLNLTSFLKFWLLNLE